MLLRDRTNNSTVQLWRGGSWKTWLQVACDRLLEHPVFTNPKTSLDNDPNKIKVAQKAKLTCQNYVWNRK